MAIGDFKFWKKFWFPFFLGYHPHKPHGQTMEPIPVDGKGGATKSACGPLLSAMDRESVEEKKV